jgi:hypothetical protein
MSNKDFSSIKNNEGKKVIFIYAAMYLCKAELEIST